LLDLADEFVTEPKTPLAVPRSRILKLVFRGAPENDAKRHRPRREL